MMAMVPSPTTPQRVLYVLERYPELSQTFVAREIEAVQRAGVAVEVVALTRGAGDSMPAPATWASETGFAARLSATATMASRSPSATAHQLIAERSWPPPDATRRIRGLTRLAPLRPAAIAADHIHAHFATEAADIARLLSATSGVPWSFTAHGADAYGDPAALRRNIESAAFARACSPHVAARLESAAPGSASRIVEIPVAVDVDRFSTGDGARADGPIVAVGRLIEKKGFDDLIAAVAAARQSLGTRELLIVGDGPLRPNLERQIGELGAPVRLLGARGTADVAELMSGASFFALTPRVAADGDRDGRPAAIVEAMAAGLPILSTSLPGIADLVGPDAGLLAAPGDGQTITAALETLATCPEARLRELGTAGQAAVIGSYSPGSVAARLLSEMD